MHESTHSSLGISYVLADQPRTAKHRPGSPLAVDKAGRTIEVWAPGLYHHNKQTQTRNKNLVASPSSLELERATATGCKL